MMQGLLIQSQEYRAQPFAGEAVYQRRKKNKTRSFELINPATLTDEMRAELLGKVQARDGFRFGFIARIFADRPNSHLMRPRPGSIGELAKASPGIPFQLDHNTRTGAKVGFVDSGFIEANASGIDELFQEVVLLRPEAQEDFLLGLLNTMSIGLTFESATCSKCDTPAHTGFFGAFLACDCELGSTFRRGSRGKSEIVEIFTDGNGLRETSFVTIGAFNDTEIMSRFQESNRSGCAFFGIAPFNPGANAAPQLPRSQPMTDPIATDPAPAPAPVVDAAPAQVPTPIAGVQAHAAPAGKTPAQRIAELEAHAAARAKQLFTALFKSAVVQFKLEPADEQDERDMFNTIGGARYAARLERKRANTAHAAQPTGAQAAPPAPAVDDTPDPTVADLSLVRSMAAQGHFKPATVTLENLAKVCGRLKFSL